MPGRERQTDPEDDIEILVLSHKGYSLNKIVDELQRRGIYRRDTKKDNDPVTKAVVRRVITENHDPQVQPEPEPTMDAALNSAYIEEQESWGTHQGEYIGDYPLHVDPSGARFLTFFVSAEWLKGIPSRERESLARLWKRAGVYTFLDEDMGAYYVGSSSRLTNRLRDHLKKPGKLWEVLQDKSRVVRVVVQFISTDSRVDLLDTEYTVMARLRPALNSETKPIPGGTA